MSLWDVDKSGDQRGAPTPNRTDQVAQRMANATTSLNPVTAETSGDFLTSSPGTLQIIATNTFTLAAADFAASGNAYLTKLATQLISHPNITAPVVFVFIENAFGERVALPYYSFDYDTGSLNYAAVASTADTSTAVEVRATTALSPGVSFRYYICRQTSAAA